jgi:hypothetical protein
MISRKILYILAFPGLIGLLLVIDTNIQPAF